MQDQCVGRFPTDSSPSEMRAMLIPVRGLWYKLESLDWAAHVAPVHAVSTQALPDESPSGDGVCAPLICPVREIMDCHDFL